MTDPTDAGEPPQGHVEPVIAWMVEGRDPSEPEPCMDVMQLGVFTSEAEAHR